MNVRMWCLGVLVCLATASCSDNRVCVDEFLKIQEEYRRTAVAPVPPTEQRMELKAIDATLGQYKIWPGDVLVITLITAMDQTNLSPPIQVRVDPNGRITLPMVGPIKVAGLSLQEVDVEIRKAYVPKVYRDMSVFSEVFRPEATNVLVSGAVTVPGLVPLRNTERNLLFAIVAAGGVSELASGKVTLKRLRCPEKQITLNLAEPKDMKKALALAPLENGDMVTVHAAVPNLIFVGGLVNAPQAQAYPPGAEITILQALAASGGPRTDLTVHEATLIRRMPDGKDIHVKLDINRIQSGRDPNLTLAAGDILWLPFTVETYTEDWINQHFYLRAGAVANVNYNVSGVEYLNRRGQQSGNYSNGGGLQDKYDPFGFINRNTALQNLTQQTTAK